MGNVGSADMSVTAFGTITSPVSSPIPEIDKDVRSDAIEETILEEGYENLTGQNVYNYLSLLSDYPVMGGLFIVNFADGQRSPLMLQIRQVEGDPGIIVTVEEFKLIPELIIPEE